MASGKLVCLDSCVWIKLLAREDGYQKLEKLFETWLETFDFFIAPSLFIFEVHSSLRKKAKRGELRTGDADVLGEKLVKLSILLYQSEELFKQAHRWAERLDETVLYDASYLALAAWKGVPYYTADEKFFAKARAHYEECYLV